MKSKPKQILKMAKINFKPIGDRVLIKPAQAEEKTSGGIIIPDTAQEKPQKGTVMAVGSGSEGNELTVKEGDTVIFGKYAGTEIEFEDETYLIMKEDDIYGII